MAAIHLKQVRKTYGAGTKAVDVIHGIDADIADGEFIVMVGPSGCGKSTLLRMVAGLEEVSSGQIVIGKRVVNDLEPKERDIAMVFQNYALYPHMTVYQNMAYGLKIQGLSKTEIDERVQRAAAILELGAAGTHAAPAFRRPAPARAMGRAIVRKPAVFLFDEPLSNLDAKLRVQMRLEIQKLHASLRTTSLYVTHDQVEAMTLGQRMIVMNRGVAEQIGTPAEVYARPATTFVASFIGSPPMNLLEGSLSADGASFEASKGEATATVRLPQPVAGAAGQERILGVRPEHLLPILDGSAAQLSLEVELVEALGAELLVHARCGGQSLVLRCPANVPVSTGQRIGASFGAGDVHWFDVKSTHRIA